MTSSTSRAPMMGDENMNSGRLSPGKAAGQPARPNNGPVRSILQDLTPNAAMSPRRATSEVSAKKDGSVSPVKRGIRDMVGEDKGFRYFKRRRLSHDQDPKTATTTTTTTPLFKQNNTPIFRQDNTPSFRPTSTALFRPNAAPAAPLRQAAARLAPLSPPSSGKHAPAANPKQEIDGSAPNEKESDEDSDNTRGSFSSLINYDPSSQQALASQALDYVNLPPSHAKVHPPPTSAARSASPPDSLRTSTERLRLRLKVAIYKVRTNQVHVPFERLRLPEPTRNILPTAKVHAHPHPAAPFLSPALSLADDLPTASHPAETNTTEDSMPYGLGLLQLPDLSMTPNLYSNRFMPLDRAPSSSPPYIHLQPSSLPRNAMTRDTPLLGRDHDSLDSEATELAEDMNEPGDERSLHAESPSHAGHARRNMSKFAAGPPR